MKREIFLDPYNIYVWIVKFRPNRISFYDVIECEDDGVPHIEGRWKVEWPDE